MRRFLCALTFLCLCVPALAQTTVTVSASNVQQDASGTKLVAGYAHFLPVNCATGQPNGFANGGQNGGGEVVLSVTNGAFTGTVVDALAANICYRFTATDISGAVVIGPKFYGAKATGYEFIQPTQNSPANNPWCAAGVCNFDNYIPLMAPVQLGQWGHITGSIANQADLVAYIIANKGTTVWGGILGSLSNQTDLNAALNAKANASSLSTVAVTGKYPDLLDTPCTLTPTGCVATVPILLSTDPALPMQATTKEYSDAETTRAQAAEATKASTTALNSETSRAEAAESSNATAITAEATRATTAEGLKAPIASPAFTGNGNISGSFAVGATPLTTSVYTSGSGVWKQVGAVLPGAATSTSPAYSAINMEPTVIVEGSPVVLTWVTTPVWKMWYDTGGYVRYAESPDGMNWTPYVGAGQDGTVAPGLEPNLVKDSSGTYHLYVNNGTGIDEYTATDGVTFTLAHSNIILGASNSAGIICTSSMTGCTVGDFYFFTEFGPSGPGFYVWTSPDYHTMTQVQKLSSDFKGTSPPFLVNGIWYMWVHTDNTSSQGSQIIRIQSTSLSGTWANSRGTSTGPWTSWATGQEYYQTTPDEGVGVGIAPTQPGQVADPYVLEVNGKSYLFYTGNSGGAIDGTYTMVIKLAVADMPVAQLVLTNGGIDAGSVNPFGLSPTRADLKNIAIDFKGWSVENTWNITTNNGGTFGTYSTNGANAGAGITTFTNGNWSAYPFLRMCPASPGNCQTIYNDFTGSTSTATGSVGHGWNFSGGRQFAGYGDNYWFRNISGNVFGAFVNTSYPAANMGTFATDHDLLMGGGIGWWTGVYNAKFTMPSVTANRSYTLPDATGIVVVAAGTPSDGYSPVWNTASGTYIPSPPVAVGTTTKIYGPTTGSPSYIQPSWTAPSTGMYTFNYTAYVSTAGTAGTFMAQMECTSGISASGSSNNANGMANTSTVILSCYYTTGGKPYINLITSGLTGSPVFTNVLWVTPMP